MLTTFIKWNVCLLGQPQFFVCIFSQWEYWKLIFMFKKNILLRCKNRLFEKNRLFLHMSEISDFLSYICVEKNYVLKHFIHKFLHSCQCWNNYFFSLKTYKKRWFVVFLKWVQKYTNQFFNLGRVFFKSKPSFFNSSFSISFRFCIIFF